MSRARRGVPSAPDAVAAPVTFRRRALLQAGTALVVGFRLGEAPAQGAAAELAPNADVRIDARGQVHVSTTQTEMGQGTLTGIAMIIADELDADWSRVQVQTMRPDGKRFMITGGSGAIQGAWEPARRAGAQARAMLLQAGATALGAAAKLPVPDKPVLKADDALQLVGQPLGAKNLTTIVRGSERYGLDLRVPGMLVATIERSPIVNGRLASFDDRAARRVPGVVDVVVVRGNIFPTAVYVRDGVAVVARNTWAALQGRKALKVEWNEANSDRPARGGALASSTRLAQDFERVLADGFDEDARGGLHKAVTAVRRGNEAGLKAAFQAAGARTIDLTFDVPLFAHAPMEPMNAIARWQPGRLEVWAPTHFQSALHAVLRHLSGLSAENVVIHTPTLGGSFGRRLEPDYAVEAPLVSRELNGTPGAGGVDTRGRPAARLLRSADAPPRACRAGGRWPAGSDRPRGGRPVGASADRARQRAAQRPRRDHRLRRGEVPVRGGPLPRVAPRRRADDPGAVVAARLHA